MGRGRENFKSLLDDENVILGFSDKFGGVSKAPFGELNLALHVGDDEKDVLKNREILASNLGIKIDNLIFMDQIHSSIVKVLNPTIKNPTCDAIITDKRGFALCVMVADCSPILIYDEDSHVCAAVHAGRAGVVSKILTKTIIKMDEIYSSKAKNLKLFVGANIKASCYEIGDLSLGEFDKFKCGRNFDINLALKAEIKELGVVDYYFSSDCTHCATNYFSYRRDGKTGRFCGIIMLK